MMIDLFNRFDKTILYKDGNNLENIINFLRYKLDNCLQNERDNIIQDIKKYEYGLKGEQKVLYELMNSHIPMYILHDINLSYKGYEAQIDFMIFTKKNFYIIECKQLYGDILIDYSGNFYRKIGSRLTPIYSPITQLERHNGKPQDPFDIANMVAFLCSEEARYITSQNIGVDGGYTF